MYKFLFKSSQATWYRNPFSELILLVPFQIMYINIQFVSETGMRIVVKWKLNRLKLLNVVFLISRLCLATVLIEYISAEICTNI